MRGFAIVYDRFLIPVQRTGQNFILVVLSFIHIEREECKHIQVHSFLTTD